MLHRKCFITIRTSQSLDKLCKFLDHQHLLTEAAIKRRSLKTAPRLKTQRPTPQIWCVEEYC